MPASTQQPAALPTRAPPPPPDDAAAYESEHVHKVYTQIAPHFAATRHAPWPKVNAFLSSLAPGSLLADVGCGNGKYLHIATSLPNPPFPIATDICPELTAIARSTGADVAVADALETPFRDGIFDAAINIAVTHHFCSADRRVTALAEIARILRLGGRALIYVWALERPSTPTPKRGNRSAKMLSRRFEAQDMFVPWHMRTTKEGATDDAILGDWEHVHRRYYHVYREGELENDVNNITALRLVESYYDHQNWCVIVEKV